MLYICIPSFSESTITHPLLSRYIFRFLFAVSLMTFSTGLLAAFITYRLALMIYWFNIFLQGAMLLISWRYALRAKLIKDDVSSELCSAISQRITYVQLLYAFGALLCIFSTYVSIVVIVLIQLNYVFAPRIRWLYRL